MRKVYLVLALAGSVSGCTSYHAEPLPALPALSNALPKSDQPLTLFEATAIAVQRSPNLALERRKADVADAQAYAAGLLPDPQFTAAVDHPTVRGPGLVNGYVLGLAEDLQALLTEPSRAESAEAKQKQAKLELVWAEWQTIQKTAGLYVQKFYGDRKIALLGSIAGILSVQSGRSQAALAQHNTTMDVAGSDLSAALDLESQRDSAERSVVAADADLRIELDLSPDAALTISDPGDPAPVTKEDVEAALRNVVQKRPDLLALQAGYHAQEEDVRVAILQQFPALTFGFNRSSDTMNVQTNGLSATLNIPIFGNVQAKIGIEQATREQLRAEYQARLDQAEADAWQIWTALGVLRKQVQELEESLPELRNMAQRGREAYAAGNLAPATYVLLETTLSAREGDLYDLRAALWTDTIALETVLAMTPLFLPQARAE